MRNQLHSPISASCKLMKTEVKRMPDKVEVSEIFSGEIQGGLKRFLWATPVFSTWGGGEAKPQKYHTFNQFMIYSRILDKGEEAIASLPICTDTQAGRSSHINQTTH